MNELAWSWFFRLPTFNFPNISEHYLQKDKERGKKGKIWQARWPCGLVPGVWWPEAGWPRTPGSQSEQGSNSQTEASVAAVPVAHISGTPALRLPGHQKLGDTKQLGSWMCDAARLYQGHFHIMQHFCYCSCIDIISHDLLQPIKSSVNVTILIEDNKAHHELECP